MFVCCSNCACMHMQAHIPVYICVYTDIYDCMYYVSMYAIHSTLTGFFTKLSWIGGSSSIKVVPTTDAAIMIPPTTEKLLSLRKNSESVRNTDWVILVLFFEALILLNSELGSDNDAMASSVSEEKERLSMSSCELVSSKPLVTSALKVRPRKLSGSTSCTATASDSRIKTTCVSFSGIGMLSTTSSTDSLRL